MLKTEYVKCPLYEGGREEIAIQVKILIPENCAPDPMVIFVTGNEHALFDSLVIKTWENFGARNDTVVIIPEHRGYGRSVTQEPQAATDYVTPQLAMADYKRIFDRCKEQFKGKWVVSGVSYGGGLSIAFSATYPDGIDVVHSSSGVVDWPAMMPEYDKGVKEILGPETYEQLCRRVDDLVPERLFDDNWYYREMVYALATGLSQIRRMSDAMLEPLRAVIALPTAQFTGALVRLDEKAGRLLSQYANANRTKVLSPEESASGAFDWRVWRYQQFTSTGTLWAPDSERSIYRNTADDWNRECEELFGFEAPIFGRPSWDVRSLASKVKAPMVITHGAKDPWRRLGLGEDFVFPCGGERIVFKDSFHSPETDEGSGNGIRVMDLILKYAGKER